MTTSERIILVCGSLDWEDGKAIFDALHAHRVPGQDQYVIHGDARGADTIAGDVAEKLGYRVIPFPAQWRPGGIYNPQAGFNRNLTMLNEEPDLVIAFWLNGSKGTLHTIKNAKRRGIPVEVYQR